MSKKKVSYSVQFLLLVAVLGLLGGGLYYILKPQESPIVVAQSGRNDNQQQQRAGAAAAMGLTPIEEEKVNPYSLTEPTMYCGPQNKILERDVFGTITETNRVCRTSQCINNSVVDFDENGNLQPTDKPCNMSFCSNNILLSYDQNGALSTDENKMCNIQKCGPYNTLVQYGSNGEIVIPKETRFCMTSRCVNGFMTDFDMQGKPTPSGQYCDQPLTDPRVESIPGRYVQFFQPVMNATLSMANLLVFDLDGNVLTLPRDNYVPEVRFIGGAIEDPMFPFKNILDGDINTFGSTTIESYGDQRGLRIEIDFKRTVNIGSIRVEARLEAPDTVGMQLIGGVLIISNENKTVVYRSEQFPENKRIQTAAATTNPGFQFYSVRIPSIKIIPTNESVFGVRYIQIVQGVLGMPLNFNQIEAYESETPQNPIPLNICQNKPVREIGGAGTYSDLFSWTHVVNGDNDNSTGASANPNIRAIVEVDLQEDKDIARVRFVNRPCCRARAIGCTIRLLDRNRKWLFSSLPFYTKDGKISFDPTTANMLNENASAMNDTAYLYYQLSRLPFRTVEGTNANSFNQKFCGKLTDSYRYYPNQTWGTAPIQYQESYTKPNQCDLNMCQYEYNKNTIIPFIKPPTDPTLFASWNSPQINCNERVGWKCIPHLNLGYTPTRRSQNGELECMSNDGQTCTVRNTSSECDEVLQEMVLSPNGPSAMNSQPVRCTPEMYTTNKHFCKVGKDKNMHLYDGIGIICQKDPSGSVFRYDAANQGRRWYPNSQIHNSYDPSMTVVQTDCTGIQQGPHMVYQMNEGSSVRCTIPTDLKTNGQNNDAYYRYVNPNTLRYYPNPEKWDPNYRTNATIIDCKNLFLGSDME